MTGVRAPGVRPTSEPDEPVAVYRERVLAPP